MGQPVRFQRANLVVADLERSLTVYRDALGLEVDYIKDSLPTSYSYPVFEFPREAKLRFCTLSAPPTQTRVLALTEVTGIDLPQPPVPRIGAQVFEVPEMDEVLGALAQVAGVEMYEEETLNTQDGRVGREVGFVDPDGHLIVIYNIQSKPG